MTTVSHTHIFTQDLSAKAQGALQGRNTDLLRAIQSAERSWSQRHIQKLEQQFNILANEIRDIGENPLFVYRAHSRVLASIHQKAVDSQGTKRSRVVLLTPQELETQLGRLDLKTRQIAAKVFSDSEMTLSSASESSSHEMLLKSFESNPLVQSELQLQSGILDPYRAESMPVGFEKYLLFLPVEQTEPLKLNLHIFDELQNDFEDSIAHFEEEGGSGLQVYRQWTLALSEIEKNFTQVISDPTLNVSENDKLQMQQALQNHKQEVHKRAHEAYLQAEKNHQKLTEFLSHDFQEYFNSCETMQEDLTYLLTLVTLGHQEAKVRLQKLYPDHTIFQCISNLIEIIEGLEKASWSHARLLRERLGMWRVGSDISQSIEKLCKRQIQNAIRFAKSQEQSLSEIFQKDSSSLFYLQMADQLGALSKIITEDDIDDILTILTTHTIDPKKADGRLRMLAAIDGNIDQERFVAIVDQIQDLQAKIDRSSNSLRPTFQKRLQQAQAELLNVFDSAYENAFIELKNVDTSAANLEEYARYLNRKYPQFLFYLEGLVAADGHCSVFKEKSEFIFELTQIYRTRIRSEDIAQKNTVLLTTVVKDEKDVQRLQQTFTEMMTAGLRFEHMNLRMLTHFLDWPAGAIQELFVNHFYALEYKDKRKMRVMPTIDEVEAYKSTRQQEGKSWTKLEQRAIEAAEAFTKALEPYRQVEEKANAFYRTLAGYLVQDTHALDVGVLTVNDIEHIQANYEQIMQCPMVDSNEAKALKALSLHLHSFQGILEGGGPLDDFFRTRTKTNPLALKMALCVNRITQMGENIQSLNIAAFEQLLTQIGGAWQQYLQTTIDFTTERCADQLSRLCDQHQLEELTPQFMIQSSAQNHKFEQSSSDLQKQYTRSFRGFKVILGAPSTHLLKWPLFAETLKRKTTLQAGPQAVLDSAKRYDNAKATVDNAQK